VQIALLGVTASVADTGRAAGGAISTPLQRFRIQALNVSLDS
jgi:hypothetical protein